MSLLVDMMTNTLDPGYAEAAARRARTGAPDVPPRALRRAAAAAAAVLAGLILVTASSETRRSAPSVARARADLVGQVQQRTSEVTALQGQILALSAKVAQLRQAGLAGSSSGRSLVARLADLQMAAGAVPVTGPAVRVTLTDAKLPAGPTDPTQQDQGGQVLDSDLQHVVNALWASGAEAVAVNGQRVTALTSIRAAGDAIVVDFRPVDPPYVVTAVGDPDTLEQSFVSSSAAAALRTYSQAYGLGFVVKGLSGATLPAAAAPALYAAQPGAVPTPSTGGSS
ncbi:MAG: hypothetical protein QOF82_448 [Frankiales bacterium]|nr:hypothetical protein [Frankiales bacterium]